MLGYYFGTYAPKVEASRLHKAPVNDDPCHAPYYTDHDQLPYDNQVFAAMYDLILCQCQIPKMGLMARKSQVPSQA